VLLARNRQYKLAEEEEKLDSDQDGIPDVYQRDSSG
jgi:NhaA family Na+:H+ antiporter